MSGGVDVSDKSLLIHPSVVVIAAAALMIRAIKTLLLKGDDRRVAPSEAKLASLWRNIGVVEEAVRDQIDGFSFSTSASICATTELGEGGLPPGRVPLFCRTTYGRPRPNHTRTYAVLI